MSPELYREANREKIKARKKAYRARMTPEQIAHERAKSKEWRLNNPEANRRTIEAWCLKNKSRLQETKRKWRIKNSAKRKSYLKQWYSENKERVCLKARKYQKDHRAERRIYHKKWRDKNPDKVKAQSQQRDSLKRAATSNLRGIKEFVKRVRSKRFATCYYCEEQTPSKGCHFDHIIPLIKGGPHSAENLCVACPACNRRKHVKTLSEWITEGQTLLNL